MACLRPGYLCHSPNIVQHQPLSVVEADAHLPLLPAHIAALHMKAGPLRLCHVQGLEPRPACQSPITCSSVSALLLQRSAEQHQQKLLGMPKMTFLDLA